MPTNYKPQIVLILLLGIAKRLDQEQQLFFVADNSILMKKIMPNDVPRFVCCCSCVLLLFCA